MNATKEGDVFTLMSKGSKKGPLRKKEETKLSVMWRRMIAEVNSILSYSLHLRNNLQTEEELRC
jgi:hypothetical protein